MLFSHDTEHSLACAVDLVNSAPVDGADEGLPDLAALHDFVHRHDVSEVGRLTTADLQRRATPPRDRPAGVHRRGRRVARPPSSTASSPRPG